MLFAEQDAPAIKAWIVKHLETPPLSDSDVDADVLADYVLALLRHDGSSDEVRELCETELYDFLKDETVPFVRDVLAALAQKLYLPKASRPPPPRPQAPPAAPTLAVGQAASKKRSYHDSSLPDDISNGQEASGPMGKMPRWDGAFHGGADQGAPYGDPATLSYNEPGESAEAFSMEAAIQMQRHMAQMFAAPGGSGTIRRNRRPCRYFEKKGFCTRPDCRFAHGPPSPTGGAASPSDYGAYGFGYGFGGGQPGMLLTAEGAGAMAAAGFPYNSMMMPGLPLFPAASAQQQKQQQQQTQRPPQRKGGRGRSELSAEGPVSDPSQMKIVVEGIPDEYLNEAAVRSFFAAFGEIVRVVLQSTRRLAVVEFSTGAAAKAAYQSPKVVFENRFVKVYWHKETGDTGSANGKGSKGGKGAKGSKGSKASKSSKAEDEKEVDEGDGGDGGDAGDEGAEDDFDIDAFLERQQAAQALHEEKKKKLEAVERQRQELEKRQRALLAKQQDERQRLIAKMAAVAARVKKKKLDEQGDAGSGGETPDGSTSSRTGGGDKTAAAAAAAAQTEMIRAQLAALEEEAKLLGLDPDALVGEGAQQPQQLYPWTPSSRGRGGGGSSSYWRGGAGRGRGGSTRGGSLSARYAAYSLDNRPRRLVLRGVDFAAPAQNEALRQYLLGVGDYEAIETVATATTVIAFTDRRTAEKFYYGLRRAVPPPPSTETAAAADASAWKSIPGVDGPVEVSWLANGGSSSSGGGGGEAAVRSKDGKGGDSGNGYGAFVLDVDSENDDVDDEDGVKADVHHDEASTGGTQQRPQNVDFDVADEDWDMQ